MADIICCENSFCVYWNSDRCILNHVSLDMERRCIDCILVNIEEQTLKNKREEYLKWESMVDQ